MPLKLILLNNIEVLILFFSIGSQENQCQAYFESSTSKYSLVKNYRLFRAEVEDRYPYFTLSSP